MNINITKLARKVNSNTAFPFFLHFNENQHVLACTVEGFTLSLFNPCMRKGIQPSVARSTFSISHIREPGTLYIMPFGDEKHQ